MTGAEVYPASRIKRHRATRDEMATRRRRICEIAEIERPATVRQIYYQTVVQKIIGIEKDDTGYDKVQDLLTDLRRGGVIPFDWIKDEGRYARQPYTVEGIPQALNDARRDYRKDPWQKTFEYVQIWVEKNALLGVLEPVTREYDVALMSAVGYSSISFLHEATRDLNRLTCPIYIYQLGDLDPSGAQAAEVIEKDLRGFAPEAEIHFERISITPEQIVEFNLQAALRPTKRQDPRYRWFIERYRNVEVLQGGQLSCELDAISADRPPQSRAPDDRATPAALPARHDECLRRAGEAADRADARSLPRRAARARTDHRAPQQHPFQRPLDRRVSCPTRNKAAPGLVKFRQRSRRCSK
jgi:hypothetical protein